MLHPPHGNRPPAVFLPTVPDLIIPAYPFVPVEDDEMALAHIAEDEFDIKIPDEATEKIVTVADAVNEIKSAVK